MKRKQIPCRSAEVNGTKPKSLRTGQELPHRQQKSRARKLSLLGFQFVYIGVLSDDFAAIDFREELCYHSLTEKAQIRRTGKGTHSKRTVIPKKSRAKNNPNFGSTPRFGLFWCGDPYVNYPNTLPLIKNCFAIIVFIGVAKMNRLCYNNKED